MAPGRPGKALADVRRQLAELGSTARAEHSTRFFKTGPGEYGEGDRFLGLKVPDVRRVSRHCGDLTFADLRQLLASPIHEQRQLALFVLVLRFNKGDTLAQKKIYDFYMRNRCGVNNWDLVDGSAPHIVGGLISRRDGFADPARTTRAFKVKAESLGVVFREQTRVFGLERRAGAWVVATEGGRFEAPVVVNCAGAWGDQIAGAWLDQ